MGGSSPEILCAVGVVPDKVPCITRSCPGGPWLPCTPGKSSELDGSPRIFQGSVRCCPMGQKMVMGK